MQDWSNSEAPESPINQACEDWAETKAAYRFFPNENVDVGKIIVADHVKTYLFEHLPVSSV